MKQYMKLMAKSLMLLVILVLTVSTGFLSVLNPNLDFVDRAEANGQCVIAHNGLLNNAATESACRARGDSDWYPNGTGGVCIGRETGLSNNAGTESTCKMRGDSDWVPSSPTVVYPSTCPAGSTGVGTPGTEGFYCEKTPIINYDSCKDANSATALVGEYTVIVKGGKMTFKGGSLTTYGSEYSVKPVAVGWGGWRQGPYDYNRGVYEYSNTVGYPNYKINDNDPLKTPMQVIGDVSSFLSKAEGSEIYVVLEVRRHRDDFLELRYATNQPVKLNWLGCSSVEGNTATEYVKQTETVIKPPADIKLDDLLNGGYGSTGDRNDGQFGQDSGNHNNGWYLDGSGNGYKTSHIQFTNLPDNGYVNALGESWSPEYLITQGKLKIPVPLSAGATAVEKQKRDTDLNTYKYSKSLSEVIAYEVTDLEALKTIQNSAVGLADLFTKNGSDYKYDSNIVSHVIDSNGESDYSKLKVKNNGYYILATKYVDRVSAEKESANPSQTILDKHTYYSFVPLSVNFMTDLGYLPVYNNLLTQVNETMLIVGAKKANHKLPSLAYQSYKSLKVPSAFNHGTNKTLLGSASGGLKLLDKDLKPITINGETSLATSVEVNDVVEYLNNFYIATDEGILHLDLKTDTLSKTAVTYSVNDLQVEQGSLYVLTDSKLNVAFVEGSKIILSNNSYDLSSMFSSNSIKAGRIELTNGLITVSSKDDSSLSEVLTLASK